MLNFREKKVENDLASVVTSIAYLRVTCSAGPVLPYFRLEELKNMYAYLPVTTGYNEHGAEIHPATFQLNAPKPQGKRSLSPDGQCLLHRAPTSKALMCLTPRQARKMLRPRTQPQSSQLS